jgi:hypothetical protein
MSRMKHLPPLAAKRGPTRGKPAIQPTSSTAQSAALPKCRTRMRKMPESARAS